MWKTSHFIAQLEVSKAAARSKQLIVLSILDVTPAAQSSM